MWWFVRMKLRNLHAEWLEGIPVNRLNILVVGWRCWWAFWSGAVCCLDRRGRTNPSTLEHQTGSSRRECRQKCEVWSNLSVTEKTIDMKINSWHDIKFRILLCFLYAWPFASRSWRWDGEVSLVSLARCQAACTPHQTDCEWTIK